MARVDMDNVLFTFGMFAILMIAYGQTIPNVNVQTNMNNLFANWPTFQDTVSSLGGNTNCGYNPFCYAAQGVAQATSFIGATIAYPGILAGSVLSRITAFGNLMVFVTFGSTGSLGTIPFGNLFLLALFIIVIVGLFRLFRGNSPGL